MRRGRGRGIVVVLWECGGAMTGKTVLVENQFGLTRIDIAGARLDGNDIKKW
jgi:hypothetical protein